MQIFTHSPSCHLWTSPMLIFICCPWIWSPPIFPDPYLVISLRSWGDRISYFVVNEGILNLRRLSRNISPSSWLLYTYWLANTTLLWDSIGWLSTCFSLCAFVNSTISPKSIILLFIFHLAKFWWLLMCCHLFSTFFFLLDVYFWFLCSNFSEVSELSRGNVYHLPCLTEYLS